MRRREPVLISTVAAMPDDNGRSTPSTRIVDASGSSSTANTRFCVRSPPAKPEAFEARAGSPSIALLASTVLTLGWTGTLAVPRGGSGAATLTGVLLGNGASAFTAAALPADATKFLNGTGAFSAPSSGLTGSYATGTFALATGQFLVQSNHVILTTTQRYTGAGTARLRITT